MLLNFETKAQHQDYFGWVNLLWILRHLDPPRMFALDHTHLAGLNPHTASFIRLNILLILCEPEFHCIVNMLIVTFNVLSTQLTGGINCFHTPQGWGVWLSGPPEVSCSLVGTCSYLSDRLFSNRHNSLPGEAPLIRNLMNQIEVEMAPLDQVVNFRAV